MELWPCCSQICPLLVPPSLTPLPVLSQCASLFPMAKSAPCVAFLTAQTACLSTISPLAGCCPPDSSACQHTATVGPAAACRQHQTVGLWTAVHTKTPSHRSSPLSIGLRIAPWQPALHFVAQDPWPCLSGSAKSVGTADQCSSKPRQTWTFQALMASDSMLVSNHGRHGLASSYVRPRSAAPLSTVPPNCLHLISTIIHLCMGCPSEAVGIALM